MIDGVKIKKLKVIPDERGRLMEILRSDDDVFIKFGQIYLTTTYPGVVKGWHYHKKQYDNITCVAGMLKVVLYDNREDSPTKYQVDEFFIGIHNPVLVQIPPMILHGWKCVGNVEALVINCPSEVYIYDEPDEFRIPPDDESVPYDWYSKRDG